jgi:short-subunit dehydrogenase
VKTKQKIVLTGANGGIGKALAHQFASQGSMLILMGRNHEQLKKLQDELPGDHSYIVADLNKSIDRDNALVELAKHAGSIDMLINNAGISCFSFFENMSSCQIQSLFETNLVSPILLTRGVMPLLNSNSAKIVNVGSTFGSIGFPGFSVYGASKFGIRGFSESLGRELKGTNVSVQYIAPRATRTTINSSVVSRMNQQLGNQMDDPKLVAVQICQAISKNQNMLMIGWPEKAFVYLNSTVRRVVDHAINTQLPTIRKYSQEN